METSGRWLVFLTKTDGFRSEDDESCTKKMMNVCRRRSLRGSQRTQESTRRQRSRDQRSRDHVITSCSRVGWIVGWIVMSRCGNETGGKSGRKVNLHIMMHWQSQSTALARGCAIDHQHTRQTPQALRQSGLLFKRSCMIGSSAADHVAPSDPLSNRRRLIQPGPQPADLPGSTRGPPLTGACPGASSRTASPRARRSSSGAPPR